MKNADLLSKIHNLQSEHLSLVQTLEQHGEKIATLSNLLADSELAAKQTDSESINELADEHLSAEIKSKLDKDLEGKSRIVSKPKAAPKAPKPPRDMRKMELEFGKVWFVRMGIISLLTGLVFLSNFAYQNYIANWSAGPRLAGLYSLAACLLGLGTYMESAKKAVSNYGKVLGAGGMAILYYASYAAFHIERLKVIDSALLGGALLLFSAMICLGYSLWKKSTITAVCSIALAFYSTSINPVGAFTLFSSLLLTSVGLYLLYRLRSASIGFTTMLGAYISFAYWQIFVNGGSNYEYANWFVLAYWILCTAAILLPRSKMMLEKPMLTYLSLNNALFFLTFCINYQSMQWISELWLVAAIYGVVLLGLAAFCKYKRQLPKSVAKVYLAKGLALITLALCLKLTGPSLALSLMVQGGLTLAMSMQSRNPLMNVAANLILGLALAVYFNAAASAGVLDHLIVVGLFVIMIEIVHLSDYLDTRTKSQYRGIGSLVVIIAVFFAVQASNLTTFNQIITMLSVVIGCNGLGLFNWTEFGRKGRIVLAFRELLSISHLLTGASILMLLGDMFYNTNNMQVFIVSGLLGVGSIMQLIGFTQNKKFALPTLYLALTSLTLILGFLMTKSLAYFLVLGPLIPLGLCILQRKIALKSLTVLSLFLYGLIWFLGMMAMTSLDYDDYPWSLFIFSIIPMIHFVLIRLNWLNQHHLYGECMITVSSVLLLIWQVSLIEIWQGTLALSGLVLFYFESKDRYTSLTMLAVIYSVGSLLFVVNEGSGYTVLNYFVALVPMAGYFLQGARSGQQFSAQRLKFLTIYSSIALFLVTSLHVQDVFGNSALSICWALLGMLILSLGFLTKDIVFRTSAFAILGVSIMRVYGADVWELGALLRILSFITLGLVLLATGYLYCRKVDRDESAAESEND